MKKSANILLRELPGVDELLRCPLLSELTSCYSHGIIKDTARAVLERLRIDIMEKEAGVPVLELEEVARMVVKSLEELSCAGLKRIINGTGTILHTNLGRALLADEAAKAAYVAAVNPVDLEMDITTGARAERDSTVESIIRSLTGAEAACVVNNNAAAVLLVLNTLAEGKEVVVSRGELIEIGGSFRLPDIIKKSGCILKEVGTTNRTHAYDYSEAVTDKTALFFKAHKSNYEVVGFTASVGLKELVKIGADKNLLVVEDLGAGALIDIREYGLPFEPVVAERLKAGADIVTFSGDKLLGGPQSGIIAGKRELVDKIRRNPLKRALRCDKMTLAALESTLKLYFNTDKLCKSLPLLRTMTRPIEEITSNADKAVLLLRERLGTGFTVEAQEAGESTLNGSIVGGGSLPGHELPTVVIKISHVEQSVKSIYSLFIGSSPPILGRIRDERFLLDMRTVNEPEDVLPDI